MKLLPTPPIRMPFSIMLRCLVLVCPLFADPASADPEKGNVIVESSTESFHIAQALVTNFNELHPDLNATLIVDRDLRGLENRPLGGNRVYLGIEGLAHPANITSVKIYLEAVAFVVHQDNPASDITLEQIKSLLVKRDDGKVMKWNDLSDEYSTNGIAIHGPLAVSEIGRFMMKDIVGALIGGYHEHERFTPIAEAVSKDPFAMGFLPIGFARRENLKMLSISGASPQDIAKDDSSAPATEYPLMRAVALFLEMADAPQAESMTTARRFTEHVFSKHGLAILNQYALIPWHPSFGPEAK